MKFLKLSIITFFSLFAISCKENKSTNPNKTETTVSVSYTHLDVYKRQIESLDSNYQDIIQLRFFEEKSIKEIAEELNLTIANTKVRIMRAKKVLAELLKNNEFDD